MLGVAPAEPGPPLVTPPAVVAEPDPDPDPAAEPEPAPPDPEEPAPPPGLDPPPPLEPDPEWEAWWPPVRLLPLCPRPLSECVPALLAVVVPPDGFW